MPYEKTVVSKPWGYEYLAYQNDKVALWFLYIGHNHQTSMHCHPNKTTGLILLDGEAQISFLGDKFDLKPVSKTMIRKGLFHSTKATSESGAYVFEIETPERVWWEQACKRIPFCLATDCRSLYDLCVKDGSMPQERRVALELNDVREGIADFGDSIRWVPTDHMLVDCLTKCMDAGVMIKYLKDTWYIK